MNGRPKIILTGLILFTLIITLLGIPFTKWGFKTDDFSNLYHTSQIKSINGIFKLFNDKSIESFCYPSGVTPPKSSFLSGLYRPISFIYYLPQYYFFGTHAYGYYLTTIIFHALNSVLLFLLFLFFVPYSLALCGALLFAFHPSLHNWLGWISAQTYQTELFALLLLVIALKKYLDTRRLRFYLIALFLYALNLWLKEATFMLPLWLIPNLYIYLKTTQAGNHTYHIKKSILVTLGFLCISISYFVSRALVFGFEPTGNTGNLTFDFTVYSFITRQKARIFDFISYVSDMFGLCWLPGNNHVFKGTIILGFTTMLVYLFIKNKNKNFILLLYVSTLLFSWPALLMHYQPRYIYLALPFFILAISICLPKKRFTIAMLSILITCNGLFLIRQLKAREQALNIVTTSFTTLINEQPITGKPLYFFGLPHHWFAMCVAQAIWFLSSKDNYPVYHNGSVVEVAGFHNYLEKPILDQDYLTIMPTDSGFLLTSKDTSKLWFTTNRSGRKLDTLEISMQQELLDQDPTFITWDYKHAKFIVIDRKSLDANK